MTYTVRQLAQRLQVSEQAIYGLCATGKLRHARVGNGRGVIRIPEEAVAEYLKSVERGGTPPSPPPTRPRVTFHHLRIPS